MTRKSRISGDPIPGDRRLSDFRGAEDCAMPLNREKANSRLFGRRMLLSEMVLSLMVLSFGKISLFGRTLLSSLSVLLFGLSEKALLFGWVLSYRKILFYKILYRRALIYRKILFCRRSRSSYSLGHTRSRCASVRASRQTVAARDSQCSYLLRFHGASARASKQVVIVCDSRYSWPLRVRCSSQVHRQDIAVSSAAVPIRSSGSCRESEKVGWFVIGLRRGGGETWKASGRLLLREGGAWTARDWLVAKGQESRAVCDWRGCRPCRPTDEWTRSGNESVESISAHLLPYESRLSSCYSWLLPCHPRLIVRHLRRSACHSPARFIIIHIIHQSLSR